MVNERTVDVRPSLRKEKKEKDPDGENIEEKEGGEDDVGTP